MQLSMRLTPAYALRFIALACGLGLLLFGPSARPAAAQGKTHCGEVSGNQTWQQGDNPHTVTCDVVVRGSTLTLAPGVRVLMNEGTSLIVEPGAGIVAPGNATVREPVQFLPNDRTLTTGFWGQILIKAGAIESALVDIQVKGGGRGGKPMVEVHAPVPMSLVVLQFAESYPIALEAEVLGPSLEAAGTARASCTSTDHPFQVSRNGIDAIQALPVPGPGADIITGQGWHHLCVPYHVLEPLTIGGPEAPSLTVHPRTVIKFGPGAGLIAGLDAENPGQFEASGGNEPDEVVLLTGLTATPGSWDGIQLTEFTDPEGLGNSLFNTRIEYGGAENKAMVRIHTAAIAALDSVFAHAPGYPVEARPDAVDGLVSALGVGSDPVFVDNAIQRIHVLATATEVDLPTNATWRNPGVPFDIDGDLLVAGRSGVATLLLEAGVKMIFKDGAELVIGHKDKGSGSLSTRGSRQSPVILTSDAAHPGAWKGVTLSESALLAELTGLRLEYGGQGDRAMLEWGHAAGALTESTLRGALGYPVAVPLTRVAAVIGEEQLDNVRRNAYPDNGTNRVLVRVDGNYTERLATWADPGVPVEFDNTAVVARAGGVALSLHSGLRLLFRAGKSLQFGDATARAAVALVRETPDTWVSVEPLDPTAGWGGMKVLKGATLEGEGLRALSASDDAANLAVTGGVVKLTDVELTGRSGGIGLDASGAETRVEINGGRISGHRIGARTRLGARIDLTRMQISGNSAWGILSEDPTVCQLATLIYWGDPSGPKDESEGGDPSCLEGAWAGSGDKVSDHVKWWRYAINTDFDPATGLGPNPIVVFLPASIKGVSGR